MRRYGGVLAALVLLWCAGCGIQPSAPIDAGPAPYVDVQERPAKSVVLYWVLDGELVWSAAPAGSGEISASTALELLFAGVPDGVDESAGTELPAGIELLSISETDTEVSVELKADLVAMTSTAQDQVACTAAANSKAVTAGLVTVSTVSVVMTAGQDKVFANCPVG